MSGTTRHRLSPARGAKAVWRRVSRLADTDRDESDRGPDAARSEKVDEPWWRSPLHHQSGLSRTWLRGTALAAIAVCTAFVLVFQFQIAPAFAYGGIVYREPNYLFLVLSVVFVWLLLVALGPGSLRGSRVLLALLVYTLGIPALIIPNIIDIADRNTSFGLVSFYFACFLAVVIAIRAAPRIKVPRVRARESVIVLFLLLFTAVTFLLLQHYVGLEWRLVGFSDVYGSRADYSTKIRESPAFLGYLIAIQMKAIGPLMLLIGIGSRRWRALAAVALASNYLLFTTTFAKQSLFAVFAVVGAYFLFRLMRRVDHRAIALAVFSVTVAASAIDWMTQRIFWTEIIVDRFFFWPGFLPVQYYETFQSRPYNLWSESPAGGAPELLVGKDLTGNADVFANASFLGDGYANMGLGGIVVEAAVLVVILYAVGCAAHRFPLWVIAPLMVMPTVALTNGSPLTAIVSGGLLPLVVLLWLSPTALLSGDGLRKKRERLRIAHRDRPRITIVTGYFDEFSGYYEVSLARELSKTCDVTVITGDRVAPIFGPETLRLLGLESRYSGGSSGDDALRITRLPYVKVGSLLLPRGILSALRAQTADAVVMMGPGQGFSVPAALFPASAARASIFGDNRAQWVSVHRALKPLKWVAFSLTKGVLYWFVMQRSDVVYGVTPNTLSRLEPFTIGRPMRLLPLPVDPEVFAYSRDTRARARERYGLTGTTVGVVGKASIEKQIERVIDSFAQIAQADPASRLVVSGLGSDEYSGTLRARVESDPLLRHRVELLGFLKPSELAELMAGLDVCVWPVQPAITIQQALVMGCRVIVPDNDLVGFLVKGGELGTAFVPGDWLSLHEAMTAEVGRERDDGMRELQVSSAYALTTPAAIRELISDLDDATVEPT